MTPAFQQRWRRGRAIAQRLGSVAGAVRRLDSVEAMGHQDILVWCHDNDRGATVDGLPFAHFADAAAELLRHAGHRVASVAHFPSSLVDDAAFGRPASLNRRLAVAHAKDLVKAALTSYRPRREKGPSGRFSNVERAFMECLEYANPMLVLSIGTPRGFAAACKSFGVPLYELLHGFGYHAIPWGYERRERRDLPDGFLVFDHISLDTFGGVANGDLDVALIENPWYELLRSHRAYMARIEGAPDLDAAIKRRKGPRGTTVLVSLQWGLDIEPEHRTLVPNAILPPALEDAIRETRDDVFWILRLHPVQLRERGLKSHVAYVRQLSHDLDNVADLESAGAPLPILLQHCDGHVTVNSMVAYEAASAGVPSLLLDPLLLPSRATPGSFMHDLLNAGSADVAEANLEEIREWLASLGRSPASNEASGDVSNADHDAIGLARWVADRHRSLFSRRLEP